MRTEKMYLGALSPVVAQQHQDHLKRSHYRKPRGLPFFDKNIIFGKIIIKGG